MDAQNTIRNSEKILSIVRVSLSAHSSSNPYFSVYRNILWDFIVVFELAKHAQKGVLQL